MLIHRVVRFAQKYSVAIVITAVVITIVLGIFALNIRYDANIIDLLPKRKASLPVSEDQGAYANNEHLILLVESDDLFTLDGLNALQTTIDKISSLPEIIGAVTPFNFITFRTDDGDLRITPLSSGRRAPKTPESLVEFKNAIIEEPLARNLVIAKDLSALGTIFFIRRMDDYSHLIGVVEQIVSDLESQFTVHLAGRVTVIEAARRTLIRDVPRFFIPGVSLILVIFYLGFRTARSVFLPLSAVVMGTVWTIGVMSLAELRLSVVSIMVPPLVLALGSSYSIHILNQYYRMASEQTEDKTWIAGSVIQINRTILLAALTTIIGFLSLLTATVPQVREFGLVTSAGIVFCLLLSLLFMPAALTLMRNPKAREYERVSTGFLPKLLDRLSVRVVVWRYPILILLLVVVAVFIFSIPRIRYQTDYTTYQRRSNSAIDDYLYSTRKFGGFVFVNVTMTAPQNQRNYFLQQEVLRPIARFEEQLRQDQDIAYIASFPSYLIHLNRVLTGTTGIPDSRGPILLLSRYFKGLSGDPDARPLIETLYSPAFDRMTIAIRIYNGEQGKPIDEVKMNQLIKRLRKNMEVNLDPETSPILWGDSLAYLSISEILSRDQIKSVAVSMLLVMMVTVISFRSFKFGLLALIPMFTGIMLTIIAMNALKIPFDVVTVMFTSVAIGVGIDDSIHLILQYRRQERIVKSEIRTILQRTMRVAGKPILLTSTALVGGLLVLSLSHFLPIAYFGILISMVLASTTLGALVVLPALLAIFFRKTYTP